VYFKLTFKGLRQKRNCCETIGKGNEFISSWPLSSSALSQREVSSTAFREWLFSWNQAVSETKEKRNLLGLK